MAAAKELSECCLLLLQGALGRDARKSSSCPLQRDVSACICSGAFIINLMCLRFARTGFQKLNNSLVKHCDFRAQILHVTHLKT